MSTDELTGQVHVGAGADGLASAVAGWMAGLSSGAVSFRVAVSGGSTPRLLFDALGAAPLHDSVAWSRWHVFFADERAVPPDDARSNYRLLRETLLTSVPIPAGQVHRMEAERADLDSAAAEYSLLLADRAGVPPRLDLVLLGLGEDGHTASLFPGTPALDVTDAWVTRGRAPADPVDRMTLTLPALNAAARVAFLVTGSSKGDALHGVVDGVVPAARVRPTDGELHWFLDGSAAATMR